MIALALLLWFGQDFREAARLYYRAAERDPSELNLLNLGRHLIAYNGAADAVNVLTWGVQRHPKSAPLRVVLSAAYQALSKYDEAAQAICDAVDADPADLRTLQFLAQIRAASDKYAGPIRDRLKGYADSYPGNAFARFHYAMMLNGAEQERELRAARRLDKDLAGPALELGILLQARGDHQESEALLKDAIRIEPRSEKAHYRLARLYQQTNRPAEARQELKIVESLKSRQ